MAPMIFFHDNVKDTRKVKHGAEKHHKIISATLSHYDRNIHGVLFFVMDNFNVSKRLATISGRPMVGCASHRLNLAVNK